MIQLLLQERHGSFLMKCTALLCTGLRIELMGTDWWNGITGQLNHWLNICKTFVLSGVELVGRKMRPVTGNLIQFFWCFGMMVLDAVAYAIRDWSKLQLAMSCYAAVFLLLWW